MKGLKKYFAFFKNEFANVATYRGPLFIWLASGAVYTILMAAVWQWFSSPSLIYFGGLL